VKRIARYLKGKVNQGIVFKPTDHNFKVWADADFGGLWEPEIAEDTPVTAKSRTGYVITYADCPVIWASQLQTETALSTTEAEYIALSTALRQTIPLMRLIKEIKETTSIPMNSKPTVYCTAFEVTQELSSSEDETTHKTYQPKYHQFRKYVACKEISVEQVKSQDQLTDIMTKNLPKELFLKFHRLICGW
jgi:hypothetical protein